MDRYIFPGLALGAALGQTGVVTNAMINRAAEVRYQGDRRYKMLIIFKIIRLWLNLLMQKTLQEEQRSLKMLIFEKLELT